MERSSLDALIELIDSSNIISFAAYEAGVDAKIAATAAASVLFLLKLEWGIRVTHTLDRY